MVVLGLAEQIYGIDIASICEIIWMNQYNTKILFTVKVAVHFAVEKRGVFYEMVQKSKNWNKTKLWFFSSDISCGNGWLSGN